MYHQPEKPPIVQQFDRYVDREYYKTVGGLIFSYEKTVRVDTIEKELILNIATDKVPNKIYYNGKEVKLIEV